MHPNVQFTIAAQFTIAKYWKQPKCLSANEWIKNYGTFTQWNSTQQRERRSLYPSQQHGCFNEFSCLNTQTEKRKTLKLSTETKMSVKGKVKGDKKKLSPDHPIHPTRHK